MQLLEISFKLYRWIIFHHISVESLGLEVAELVFGNGGVCQNKVVPLPSLFNIVIKDFADFPSCLYTVHRQHLYIHNYEFVGILTILNSLRAFHYSLFSTACLIRIDIEILLEDHFQNLKDEYCVIYQKDLIIFLTRTQLTIIMEFLIRLSLSIAIHAVLVNNAVVKNWVT